METALIQEEYADFVLKDEAPSCWIEVDGLSVYISRMPGAVSIDVFKVDEEMNTPLASTYAMTGNEDDT